MNPAFTLNHPPAISYLNPNTQTLPPMPIKKLTADSKPPRRWAIVAFPCVGKSTFATRMRGPLVVADIDGRFAEVHTLAGEGNVGVISGEGMADASDANDWADRITRDIQGEKFGTLVADSITPVIEPLLYDVATERDPAARNKLLLHKAATANKFFNALVRHGNDVLLVWHLKDTMVNGQGSVRTTLSKTETDRLKMHLNAILEIAIDEPTGKRGIIIVWARNGRDNITIWDDSGSWVNMPEKIEAHLYGSPAVVVTTEASHAAAKRAGAAPAATPVAGTVPTPGASDDSPLPQSSAANFANKSGALAWAVQQRAFPDLAKAGDAYESLKKAKGPKTAGDMFQIWRTHVASLTTGKVAT